MIITHCKPITINSSPMISLSRIVPRILSICSSHDILSHLLPSKLCLFFSVKSFSRHFSTNFSNIKIFCHPKRKCIFLLVVNLGNVLPSHTLFLSFPLSFLFFICFNHLKICESSKARNFQMCHFHLLRIFKISLILEVPLSAMT